jgi:hypothetical protein
MKTMLGGREFAACSEIPSRTTAAAIPSQFRLASERTKCRFISMI